MAKDKERSVNPAQQQRKAEKAKALKKAKTEQQNRRNEKLAKRNPDRIQRQIDDLKALEAAGDLKAYEKAQLEELERDIKAVRKAREALGEKAPQQSGNRQPQNRDQDRQVLGKRQHNGDRVPPRHRRQSDGSDTDDSVRRIPMPEDTPPPIPREHRRYFNHQNQDRSQNKENPTPVVTPAVEQKTTYSAAPQLRDLKKEATSRFVPDIVKRKQAAVNGEGGLLEPEELDKLEAQGYYGPGRDQQQQPPSNAPNSADLEARRQAAQRLAEEEARFAAEMAVDSNDQPPTNTPLVRKTVYIEEVEDEDA
ncbi:Protein saf1 [Cyphellophora attinorum]|uniref:Protein saf1 n=1 Tax=Cyphellophora attinorum TaxID=1664694 RepID=A0A0N1HSE4_9EURO|nr:Protein saf1 [Phialophora attinorum]KPI41514.1 Protein saf1 [Phialophora attinorum]